MKTADAALAAGVSRYQVLRWIRSGELRARRIGRDYWVTAKDLAKLLGVELHDLIDDSTDDS